MKNINRNVNLDVIRSLAIVIVVFCHLGFFCWGIYSNEPMLASLLRYDGLTKLDLDNSILLKILSNARSDSFNYGIFGVSLFFILSGYLFAKQSLNIASNQILIKRICRIIIPLFFIYFIIFNLLLAETDFNLFVSKYSILGLFFYFGDLPSVGIFWTLEIELLFYFLFAIFRPNNIRNTLYLIAFLIFAKICLNSNSYFHKEFHFYWQFLPLVGCAFIFKKENLFILLFFIITFLSGNFKSSDLLSALLAYIVFISILSINNIPFYIENCCKFIAKISYSLYLIHLPILAFTTYNMQKMGYGLDMAVFFGLIFSILISYISSITFESIGIFAGKILTQNKIKLLKEKSI